MNILVSRKRYQETNDIVLSSGQCDLLFKISHANSFRNIRNQIVIKSGPETKVQDGVPPISVELWESSHWGRER